MGLRFSPKNKNIIIYHVAKCPRAAPLESGIEQRMSVARPACQGGPCRTLPSFCMSGNVTPHALKDLLNGGNCVINRNCSVFDENIHSI